MREADFDAFSALLDDTAALLARHDHQALTPTARAMYFRALQQHPLAAVRSALDAHVKDPQRGRFFPMPADVIAQIDGLAEADGRPGVEEAWAIALRSKDEADTVVWTSEIAQALGIAKPVLDRGDEVGARMAFREAYARLVEQARRQRMPASWAVSLGFDTERRDQAISAAVACGRLPAEDLPRLPAPTLTALSSGAPPEVREQLLALADRLRNAPEPESIDAAARRETAERKAETARKVAEYQRQRALLGAELRLVEEGDAQGDAP